MTWTRRGFLTLLFPATAAAQTLAHPGWRGNGIASEAWWKHGAFVRFGADTTFTQAAQAMDAMSQTGADSIILPDLQPSRTAQPDADGIAHPFDLKFGSEDDLDALLREASARRMHVLLRANLLRLASNQGELRFWMSRGIAGFDVGEVSRAEMDTLRLLRSAMDRFPGRRILLAHIAEIAAAVRGRLDPVTLHVRSMQELASHTELQSAVEVHNTDAFTTPLPPNTTLIADAALLASDDTREVLRRAIAAQGRHVQPHPGGRSAKRRSR